MAGRIGGRQQLVGTRRGASDGGDASLGIEITKVANEQLGFVHPENRGWDRISFCQFAAPVQRENGI